MQPNGSFSLGRGPYQLLRRSRVTPTYMSWLAVKYSLTHHPSSQGWASSVRLCCCLNVFVFLRQICMSEGEGGMFLSFLVSVIGWYAIYNNFMLMLHTCVSCTLSVVINMSPHFDYFLPLHSGTGHGRPLLCLSVPPERHVDAHPSASATELEVLGSGEVSVNVASSAEGSIGSCSAKKAMSKSKSDAIGAGDTAIRHVGRCRRILLAE